MQLRGCMKDIIERSVYFASPIDRVWRALTTKEEIKEWFPDKGIDGELEAGADVFFQFTMTSTGELCRCRAMIEDLTKPSHFAYRWMPGDCNEKPLSEVPTTLVEFFLNSEGEGTRVTVKESGFASLPPAMYEQAFKDNSNGWEEVMESFRKYGEKWSTHSTTV